MGAQISKEVEMSAFQASAIAAFAIGLAGCMLSPIDSVIRQSAGLTAFPIEGIGIGGGNIQVRAGCPLD